MSHSANWISPFFLLSFSFLHFSLKPITPLPLTAGHSRSTAQPTTLTTRLLCLIHLAVRVALNIVLKGEFSSTEANICEAVAVLQVNQFS